MIQDTVNSTFMEENIKIQGTVQEVRTFLSFVTVYILVASPSKFQGSLFKVSLNNNNCNNLLKWSQLENGAEISVVRTQNAGIPRNRTYTFEVLKSQVIDFDDVR